MNIKKPIAFVGIGILSYQFLIAQDFSFKPNYNTILDSTRGVSTLNQCSRSIPIQISKFWTPAQEDVEKLHNNFKKVQDIKATGCCIIGRSVENLEGYGFQYLGVIIKNKRYIYINAFYVISKKHLQEEYKTWKKEPVVVCDGGEGFWGVLFDIQTLEFSELSFNGIA